MPDTANLSKTKKQLLELYLRQREEQLEVATSPIPKREDQRRAPLSFSQEQVWVHAQMDPRHPVYNELVTIHRRGSLDIAILKRALVELVRRHEMWRTTLDEVEGAPMQIIQPVPRDIDLPFTDLRGLPPSLRKPEALRLAEVDGHIPFDLKFGLLWRARVVQVEDEYFMLFMTMHQIIMDGVTGFRVLMPEIAAIYEAFAAGQPSPLEELPFQYADFAIWQRSTLTDEVLAPQLAYWTKQLSGELPALEWPNDRPRPPIQTLSGATESLMFPGDLMSSVKSMATSEGATLYMALLASFAALLHRYTNQEKITLGTLTAGRKRPDLDKLMGYFLNPLILPIDLSGEPTFRQLLRRVRNVVVGALSNPDVPFLRLVKEFQTGRDLSRTPFFTVIVSLEPPMAATSSAWDFTLTDASSGGAKLDLYLNLYERPDGVAIPMMYNPDLFERSTILRMHQHWQNVMQAVCANPDLPLPQLSILSEPEREQRLHEWNSTRRSYPQLCIHELFEQQASRTPNATAIMFGNDSLTYAQLNQRSNQLARYLRRLGARPDERVGICVTRSLDMVVGLLGILKAGSAYVPMDPTYPRERLAQMNEDAGCAILLTQQAVRNALPESDAHRVLLDADWRMIERENAENLEPAVTPADLAYVIYTSGSTGKPKGVQIEHRSVVNFLLSMQREPGLDQQDVLVAVTSISFDIAGLEIYLPLITGANLVIAATDVAMDGVRLAKLLYESKATVMQATPATWRLLVDAGWTRSLKILCGGEALPQELARQLTSRSTSVWNLYGPTETTIWSAVHRVQNEGAQTEPIGGPIANTQFYVLDSAGNLAPIGIAGELCVGGDGLARGYFRRAEETAAKFVTNPFDSVPGSRIYRTGDLVRYRSNGDLEFLGRLDNQVKVRGFRIELGEIESVLAQHPHVKGVVAMVRGASQESTSIVAYVAPQDGHTCTDSEILTLAREKLPAYMVPSRIVLMKEFPLTPNKKVDRRALPEPEAELPASNEAPRIPGDAVELRLLRMWESVLRVRPLALDQNFFDAGGHSLLAAQLIHKVEQSFGVQLSMAALFLAPTVLQMAQLLRGEARKLRAVEIMPLQPQGRKTPFLCICVDAGPMYFNLLQHFDPQRPFLGVELNQPLLEQMVPPYRMEAVAEILAASICSFQPEGPYYVGGYCISGLLAYETARALERQGRKVGAVGMFLASNPAPRNEFSKFTQVRGLLRRITQTRLWNLANTSNTAKGESSASSLLRPRVANFTRDLKLLLWQIGFATRARLAGGKVRSVRELLFAAARHYVPCPISAPVGLFLSQGRSAIEDPTWGWGQVVPEGRLNLYKAPGNDWAIFGEPNAHRLAWCLEDHLRRAEEAIEFEKVPLKREALAVS